MAAGIEALEQNLEQDRSDVDVDDCSGAQHYEVVSEKLREGEFIAQMDKQ